MTVAEGGADSRDLLRQVVPGGADWLICSIGTNDAAPWKRVPLADFAINCDRWLNSTRPYQRLLLGPGPVRERGVVGERTNAVVAEYAATLEQLALRHRVGFISIAGVVEANDLAGDGVHLADSGYAKLTAQVLTVLIDLTTQS